MSKRKAPSSEDNLNHDFCDFLIELSNYEKNVTRNIYKSNAYRKAATTLSTHPTRITSGKEAQKLNGVGEKIAKKIDEFLETGKLRKLENLKEDDMSTTINLLTRVTGIGPAKARQLYDNGVRSLEDLENHKDDLTHHQLIGLKYFKDFELKIPRAEIAEIEAFIKMHLKELDPKYLVTICGSYRRGKSESGDIDVLLTHPNFTSKDSSDVNKKKTMAELLNSAVNVLKEKNLITDTISAGDVKFMGACSLRKAQGEADIAPVRRLDIRLTPHDQYHCSILYFTGSDMFNKAMRAHALSVGFTLNEYSVRFVGATGVPGEAVPISSEEEIFEYLNYPYKPPNERN